MSMKENALAVTSDEGAIPNYTETARELCHAGGISQGGQKAPAVWPSCIDIERRQFLVRLVRGAGWPVCVLVAWMIGQYAIAVVFLICCGVAFVRAARDAADRRRQ